MISYHNTGNNWTNSVNSKLSVIWKRWWWSCLILLLNSQLTVLLGSLSYVFIVSSNAGYTMFRGSVKSTGYPLHSPVTPSLPLPCVTVCHHISTGVYFGSIYFYFTTSGFLRRNPYILIHISGSNAGYTMFRGSVKSTGYPLHSPVSPLLPLLCVTVCHHILSGVY